MNIKKQMKPLAKEIEPTYNLTAVQNMDELKELVDQLYNSDKILGFDIETGYSGNDYPERAVNVYHPQQFITSFSITNSPTWARYVPLRHDFGNNLDPNEVWELMKPLLEEKPKVCHNLQFEAENLRALDRKGDGPRIDLFKSEYHDSMLQAYVLNDVPPMYLSGSLAEGEYIQRFIPSFHQDESGFQSTDVKAWRYGLKDLTNFRYNYKQKDIFSLFNGGKPLTAEQRKKIRFNPLPIDASVIHYACDDAYLCLRLHEDQMERLAEDPYLPNVYRMEMMIVEILVDIREPGITVDWDMVLRENQVKDVFVHEMKLATQRAFEAETGTDLSTLNFKSPKQMGELLFGSREEGGLELISTRKTDSGAYSTDEVALNNLKGQSPAVTKLLEYRRAIKMGDFFKQWASLSDQFEDRKLHPSFLQTTVPSGRFASSSPNVQNLPKRWWYQKEASGTVAETMREGVNGQDYWTGNARNVIMASPGYRLLSFDYQSAEVQFLAALSEEASMIDAFFAGEDFHSWTAAMVSGKDPSQVTPEERQSAKSVTFGNAYRQSVSALAETLGITRDEAQKVQDTYFSRFPNLKKFFDMQDALVKEFNEVRTWMGRRVTLWQSMVDNTKTRNSANRIGTNAPIQGGATGDYPKLAMIRVYNALRKNGWWGKEVRLLMNQHDSLVFEYDKRLPVEEVIEVLEPLVSFDLTGVDGTFVGFNRFPPMSVDWEHGDRWGEVYDVSKPLVEEASNLHIYLTDEATTSDVAAVRDVVVTNPGECPVTLHFRGEEITMGACVKPHQSILDKLKKGDSSVGISHRPGDRVSAEFVV